MFKWIGQLASRRTGSADPKPGTAAATPDFGLIDTLYASGELASQRGAFDEAERNWRHALDLAPDFEAAYHALCHLLLATGKPREALDLISSGINHIPHSASLHFYLGNLQYETQLFALAASSYQNALAIDPERAEVWANLGLAQLQQDRFDDAIFALQRTLELNPDAVDARHNLADAYFNQGISQQQHQVGIEKAVASYENALTVLPTHLPSLINLGNAASMQGRFEDAESVLRSGLQFLPDQPELLTNLGLALQAQSKFQDAVVCYEATLLSSPAHIDARYNLGVALQKQGQYDAAIACYRMILSTASNHLGSLFNLAHALQSLKRTGEAETIFRQILDIDAGHIDARLNLGLVLREQGQLDEALACFREILQQSPEDYRALSNIGTVLQEQALLDQALAAYHEALDANGDSIDVRINIANLLMSLNRYDEAIVYCDSALAVDPGTAQARLCKSFCMLALGEYEAGWRDYECRWQCTEAGKPALPHAEWNGQDDLAGKTILLYAEQGLGDTLQFVRYASVVAEKGATVLVLVPRELATLAASCPGVAQVFTSDQITAPYDYHCSMMSLPFLCGTRLHNIPARVPYLFGHPEKQKRWQERLDRNSPPGGLHRTLRVGLVWAGNPRKHMRAANFTDRMRSLRFGQIAPLLDVAGIEFYSLQLGEEAVAQLNRDPRVIDLTADLHDFEDTAALMSNLDLVISVDTSVVHLAGAIGKPVWVLNRYNSCWRWMTGRSDSPWYPSLKLFRQPHFGDWESVINEARSALAALVIEGGKEWNP